MDDTLATLNWLVEAGADEAIADQPVNRMAQRPTIPSPFAGEGNSSRVSATNWEGGKTKGITPPPSRIAAPPLPQGEGEKDAIGSAMAGAGAAQGDHSSGRGGGASCGGRFRRHHEIARPLDGIPGRR